MPYRLCYAARLTHYEKRCLTVQTQISLCTSHFAIHSRDRTANMGESAQTAWMHKTGPEVIKLFSCSTQLSMKIFPLINVKMPTIVCILTFMNGKNSILGLSEPDKCWISWYFHIYEQLNFYTQLSWAWKKFYNLGPWSCSLVVIF